MRLIRIRLSRVAVLYVLIAMIVFFSNDTTLFGTNMNRTFVSYGFIIEAVLATVFLLANANNNSFKIKINANTGAVFILYCSLIVISGVVNTDLRGGYYTTILLAFLGIAVSHSACLFKSSIHILRIFLSF